MAGAARIPGAGGRCSATANRLFSGATKMQARAGYTLFDLVVALFLAAIVLLFMLIAIPRGREQARLAACQKNLGQIGLALGLYDQSQGQLPSISALEPLDDSGRKEGRGPLKIMLEALGQADFMSLAPNSGLPRPTGPVPGEIAVPGFVCSSDPRATSGLFPAPISYRGSTGGDPLGKTGLFALGRRLTLTEIEDGQGSSYTASFSERLVGDGASGRGALGNFAEVVGPLPDKGCSPSWLEGQSARWRGDAGATWVVAGYRCTLYNHAAPPNASLSCVAADGRSAFMGASSGHLRGVNLLMLDASVKLILPSIDAKVWKRFATVAEPVEPSGE
jgi:hypothetical protein